MNDNPAIGLAASGSGNISAFKALNNTIANLVAHVTVIPKNAALAYVANQSSNSVSIINTSNGKITGSIQVDKNPYAVTVTPDATKAFVANQGSSTISVINTATNSVVNTLSSGPNPSGMAVSPDGSMLYISNGSANSVTVININNGLTVANIMVGTNPQGIVVNPDGSYIYVANRNSSTVSIINASTLQVVASPKVGTNPESIAISPDGNMVYVTNYASKSISVISAATNTVTLTISNKYNPTGVAITPDGNTLYVTNGGDNSVNVINLANNAIITTIKVDVSPESLSISPDGQLVYVANFGGNDISVISTATNIITRTIGLPGPPVSFGNFIAAGTGCSGDPVTFKITVTPAESHITATGTLTALTTVYGTPSSSATFNVSASDITANILVTPPAGFEVSLDNTTFSNTVTIATTNTTVPVTPVYIRLAAVTAAGSYDGNIILSSTGVAPTAVPVVISTVTPASLIVIADDKVRQVDKANPVFTATYKGFVNNETAAQITTLPIITSTALITSPIGKYPIMADGAVSANYTFTYVDGVLTVQGATDILIPNTFTPNGDGINDTWNIKNLDGYPNCTVSIFSRSGQMICYLNTYATAWDGRYNGKDLPTGTYYYVINLNNGEKPFSGSVVIIR